MKTGDEQNRKRSGVYLSKKTFLKLINLASQSPDLMARAKLDLSLLEDEFDEVLDFKEKIKEDILKCEDLSFDDLIYLIRKLFDDIEDIDDIDDDIGYALFHAWRRDGMEFSDIGTYYKLFAWEELTEHELESFLINSAKEAAEETTAETLFGMGEDALFFMSNVVPYVFKEPKFHLRWILEFCKHRGPYGDIEAKFIEYILHCFYRAAKIYQPTSPDAVGKLLDTLRSVEAASDALSDPFEVMGEVWGFCTTIRVEESVLIKENISSEQLDDLFSCVISDRNHVGVAMGYLLFSLSAQVIDSPAARLAWILKSLQKADKAGFDVNSDEVDSFLLAWSEYLDKTIGYALASGDPSEIAIFMGALKIFPNSFIEEADSLFQQLLERFTTEDEDEDEEDKEDKDEDDV